MAHGGEAHRRLRSLLEGGAAGGLADGQLLERFQARRTDEAGERAFEALVDRHGPMVLRVCRDALRDPHDAQDAFQATFLVLARKAASIRRRDAIGPWLHGVALRVASASRAAAARRRRHERRAAELAPRLFVPEDRPEDSAALHEEIGRLPERYRTPLVLCYLEGRTCEEAARLLGWPVGTVKSRLSRARDRLRARLDRRGPSASTVLLGASPAVHVQEVPPAWAMASVRAAMAIAAGRAMTAGGAPATVVALAEGASRAMSVANLWKIAPALLVVAAGAAVLAQQGPATPKDPTRAPAPSTEDEQELRRIERAIARAIVDRDAEAIAPLLADDLTGIDPVGNVTDKATYLADVKSGTFGISSFEFSDLKVRLYGEAAVVVGVVKSRRDNAKPDLEVQGRITHVFTKRGDRWRIVAWQESGGLGGPGAPRVAVVGPAEPVAPVPGVNLILPPFVGPSGEPTLPIRLPGSSSPRSARPAAVPEIQDPADPEAGRPGDESPVPGRAKSDRVVSNLKRIGVAFHNHLDAFHQFPPPAILDAEGKPGLSWRVAILPFLGDEGSELYQQFHLDERWDSPHNKPLLEKMPAAYRLEGVAGSRPEDTGSKFATPYRVFVGPGAFFNEPKGTPLSEIRDGTFNTLLVVEAAVPMPWTAPDTLAFGVDLPLPRLGGRFEGGSFVLLADGRVRFLKEDASPAVLRTWITRDGGEHPQEEIFRKEAVVPAPPAGGATTPAPTTPGVPRP